MGVAIVWLGMLVGGQDERRGGLHFGVWEGFGGF